MASIVAKLLDFFDREGKWRLSRYSHAGENGAPAVRFKERRSSIAQLNRDLKLIWSGFASNVTRTVDPGFKVVDFAIISRVKPHLGLGRAARISQQFFTNCQIVRYAQDPWTWLGIGITAEGKLVFEMRGHDARDTRSQCLVTDNSNNQDIQIDRTQGFPRLKLTKFDGSIDYFQ